MEQSPIIDIVKKACPAVITIVISKDLPKIEGFYMVPFGGQGLAVPRMGEKKEKTKIGGGSGFIISPDGMILTSQHVVADPNADYIIVLGPKEKYPAKVLARDSINDIAILKIDPPKFFDKKLGRTRVKNLPCLELGDSKNIALGQAVITIGNALGEFHDTVSTGVVSGLSRNITAFGGPAQQTEQLRGLIQTDAAINPGNSGGPLVDMNGKVIGINTAMVAMAQNIGFAIPIDYAKKDLEEVKKYGKIKNPFLGVRYILLSKAISEKNKLPVDYGAFIVRENLGESAIIPNSAAEKAGLKEFDIILECQGEKITTENPLSSILQKFKIGKEVELKILRPTRNASYGGADSAAAGRAKEQIIKVKLEEKK